MPRFNLISFQSEHEWLTERRKYITASDAPVLCGKVNGKNAMTVWADKIEPVQTNGKREVFMRIGHELEQLNADLYEEATHRELHDFGDYTLCVSKEIPYLAATLDRMVTDVDLGKGCHELKWRGSWNQKSIEEYWCQLQHQLLVTGYKWGSISILDASGHWDWFGFDRDDQFLSAYKTLLADFWANVLCRTCPGPLDGSDATQDALKRAFPQDCGKEIVLPWEVRELDEWYVELQSAKKKHAEEGKRLDREQKEIEQKIRVIMGDAAVGIADTFRYELITTERKGYTVEPAQVRSLKRKAVGE